MDSFTLNNLKSLIADRTGLYIWNRDLDRLAKVINKRLRSHHLAAIPEYLDMLRLPGEKSREEWKILCNELTTTETFFFRDKGQFSLLQNRILPQIIQQNGSTRSIRIWSAGCASGEEPYSIAILLSELLAGHNGWEVLIIGTDLNETALQQARVGKYSNWSFRMVDPLIKAKYFTQYGDQWAIHDSIKNMVNFLPGNLKSDKYPDFSLHIHSMHLIICRNVFIYFDHGTVQQIIQKFNQTLQDGGYLLTGHTELYGHDLGQLQTFSYIESTIFKKSGSATETFSYKPPDLPEIFKPVSQPISKPLTLPKKVNLETGFEIGSSLRIPDKSVPPPPESSTEAALSTPVEEAKLAFENGNYRLAIQKINAILEADPNHFDAIYLAAESWANLGEHESAKKYCRKALEMNQYAIQPYYLLSKILEEEGNRVEAKSCLKKIIYLAPQDPAAYVELASIYRHENDLNRASKMYETAYGILKKMPQDAIVEPFSLHVAEILTHVKQNLNLS